jgi:hypothetical protein
MFRGFSQVSTGCVITDAIGYAVRQIRRGRWTAWWPVARCAIAPLILRGFIAMRMSTHWNETPNVLRAPSRGIAIRDRRRRMFFVLEDSERARLAARTSMARSRVTHPREAYHRSAGGVRRGAGARHVDGRRKPELPSMSIRELPARRRT